MVQQQPNGQVVQQVSPQAIQQATGAPQQQAANPAQPQQPQQPNTQTGQPKPNGQPAKPAPTPVNMAAPQYDVKVVTKGVESFMVSFNFATTPITQIADYIIISASKHNTSDIHFDPREDGMMVRFRIDGDCQDYTYVPKAYEKNLTTRLKLMANMNITESRLPQDGAIKGTFGDVYLDRLFVDCKERGKGAGKYMVKYLLDNQKYFDDYFGCDSSVLLVEPTDKTVDFYSNLGFHHSGYQMYKRY